MAAKKDAGTAKKVISRPAKRPGRHSKKVAKVQRKQTFFTAGPVR